VTETTMPEFPGVERFLFESGLYAKYTIALEQADMLFDANWRIDGHCPYCHQATVFSGKCSFFATDRAVLNETKSMWKSINITCQRNRKHGAWFDIYLSNGLIQKVGQYPSLADIANDEAGNYRKILGPHDSREFSRAIGLAAHGVGIGSFVYLRRIFERLVRSRFDQFRETEGWSDGDFRRFRMEEKIQYLSKHLPEFLVRNRSVYAILSQGIHELEDDECLSFFPILKSSIIVILEEDQKKMEEMARQRELEQAIAALSNRPRAEG
jgi:hypothetical protein